MKVVTRALYLLLSLALLAPVTWGAESEPSAGQAVSEESNQKSADPASSPADEKDPENEPVTLGDLNGLRTELETLRDQFQTNFDTKTATTSRALKFSGSA